jgi:hypothetical protein
MANNSNQISLLIPSLSCLNDMLAGRLPHVPEHLDSDGLPFRNLPGGIRPIAIGEARLRLAVVCAAHECNDLGPSLAPLQLGVGISRPPLGSPKVLAMPSVQPSTHTPTIYSCPWAEEMPSTVSHARQFFTQPWNTPPHSFLISSGRTAARRGFFSKGRHTTPPKSPLPAA